MTKVLRTLILGAVLCTGPNVALAKHAALSPTVTTVLQADESGTTRVVLQFDLGSLRSSSNRKIDWAYLEWRPTTSRDPGMRSFVAQEIVSLAVERNVTTVTVTEEPESAWDIEPAEFERDGGAYVRLDVTELVSSWNSGGLNHGILVSTPSVSRTSAVEEVGSIVLHVGYGFRP